jgi:hypothetical protein
VSNGEHDVSAGDSTDWEFLLCSVMIEGIVSKIQRREPLTNEQQAIKVRFLREFKKIEAETNL